MRSHTARAALAVGVALMCLFGTIAAPAQAADAVTQSTSNGGEFFGDPDGCGKKIISETATPNMNRTINIDEPFGRWQGQLRTCIAIGTQRDTTQSVYAIDAGAQFTGSTAVKSWTATVTYETRLASYLSNTQVTTFYADAVPWSTQTGVRTSGCEQCRVFKAQKYEFKRTDVGNALRLPGSISYGVTQFPESVQSVLGKGIFRFTVTMEMQDGRTVSQTLDAAITNEEE
ncbi:hypothetical protein D2E26_0798 [Bifidobacterium dolichotidis]|uniref:Secreted protein n=1 Tax=Bifidobacterium dolichotidis TaxID=2306976 RepID=A0A430FPL9_9BIFI|nr:hypothetical protein [Bifidobacterium dolichotidis]RSX54744.1 hypothetical protein D2E26_0798 [Bifidobacterium dolichotidis]